MEQAQGTSLSLSDYIPYVLMGTKWISNPTTLMKIFNPTIYTYLNIGVNMSQTCHQSTTLATVTFSSPICHHRTLSTPLCVNLSSTWLDVPAEHEAPPQEKPLHHPCTNGTIRVELQSTEPPQPGSEDFKSFLYSVHIHFSFSLYRAARLWREFKSLRSS